MVWLVCLSRPYHFKFFKDYLAQILLGPFLNILSQIREQVNTIIHVQLLKIMWIFQYLKLVLLENFNPGCEVPADSPSDMLIISELQFP